MTTIQQYIQEKSETMSSIEISNYLNISLSMITAYKKHKYNASLTVAKIVYKQEGLVLHPFSEESLKYEIFKDKKC